jgi:hypothetical protein
MEGQLMGIYSRLDQWKDSSWEYTPGLTNRKIAHGNILQA